MKAFKIIFILLFSITLFSNSVSANWWPWGEESSNPIQNQQLDEGQVPEGMELPDDWDEMTEEEQQEYMEENRPDDMMDNMELPDDWDEMTEEEQQEWLEENKPDDMGNGHMQGGQGPGDMGDMELPDDWDEMTEEEQQEYMEENRPEGMELPDDWDEMTEEEQQEYMEENWTGQRTETHNYTRTARKGSNYKGFSGEIQDIKEFSDEDEIENQEAVQFLQQRGILNGYEDGTFKPQNPISRAESIKVLLEALGIDLTDSTEDSFSDISEDDWFYEYVNTAEECGFIKGYEDGTFKPNQTVNQAELLKIAFESFGIDLSDYEVTSLPEGADEDAWYAPYLQYALDNDLLSEDDIDLSEGMTREMFSELIYRLIQQQEAIEETA